jgi:ABC-type Fe3+-hydroxamate transport system substrate-binding protein
VEGLPFAVTIRRTSVRGFASAALLWAGLTQACRTESNQAGAPAPVLRDDFGDTVALTGPAPRRIVSLNPATTAMLFAVGAGPRVVGRTRWDTYPPEAASVPSLGDGLRPNVEAVLATHPDLVLLYANGDDRDAARQFRAAGVATLSVRDDHVADFRRVLRLLGLALRDTARAAQVADSVTATLARVRAATARFAPVPVVWQAEGSPLLVIGGGSYLSELLHDAGGRNLYADLSEPAPQVSLEDVLRRNPDVVLTTTSAARSLRADPRWRAWLDEAGHRVLIPDSALVGMPSVRMGESAIALAVLLHPGAVH